MMNVPRTVSVVVQWTTIVTVVCVAFVWLLPDLTTQLTPILFHTMAGTTPTLTFGSVLLYILIWDVLAALGAWLFATLWNMTEK